MVSGPGRLTLADREEFSRRSMTFSAIAADLDKSVSTLGAYSLNIDFIVGRSDSTRETIT